MFAVTLALEIDGRSDGGRDLRAARPRVVPRRARTGCLPERRAHAHQSPLSDHNRILLGTGFPFRARHLLDIYLKSFAHFFNQARGVRRGGAAALDLAYVAAGRLDGFWELTLSPWDIAAGVLLIEEAGGRVTDFFGGDTYLAIGPRHRDQRAPARMDVRRHRRRLPARRQLLASMKRLRSTLPRDFWIVLGVALVVRLVYFFLNSRSNPAFDFLIMDSKYIDAWAQAIASGHPGDSVYFRGPLVPYLFALVHKLGGGVAGVVLVNHLAGTLTCGLVWLFAREYFGRAVALTAGLVAALYWPFVYFEGEVLIEPVYMTLVVLSLWRLARAVAQPSMARLVIAGACVGLTALARPTDSRLAARDSVRVRGARRRARRRREVARVAQAVARRGRGVRRRADSVDDSQLLRSARRSCPSRGPAGSTSTSATTRSRTGAVR